MALTTIDSQCLLRHNGDTHNSDATGGITAASTAVDGVKRWEKMCIKINNIYISVDMVVQVEVKFFATKVI